MIRFHQSISGAVLILAVALIAGGVWLNSKRAQIAEIETQTALLEERIVQAVGPAAQSSIPTPTDEPGGIPSREPSQASESIDWQMIIGSITTPGNRRERQELQHRLQAMSFPDLIDEMEQARKHGLNDHWVVMIFLNPLADKDPASALDLFYRDAPRSARTTLRSAFNSWATQDPARSSAWLDQQIALGHLDATQLDGVNEMRVHFEEALLESLIKSNPQIAEQRLNMLTEEEAYRVLQTFGRDLRRRLEKDDYAHYAHLIREGLPEARQLSLLSETAGRILHQGDAEFTGFLSAIQATPAERDACVAHAIGRKISHAFGDGAVTVEAVDEIREWAGSLDAGGIDRAVGGAIGKSVLGRRVPFEDAAELALHYQTISGQDDALIGFLSNHQRSHCDDAQALVDRIKDPARVAELPGCIK